MDAARRLRLYHTLQLAAHRLKVQADRDALEAAGLTAAQAGVLFTVGQAGEIGQRELARRLKVRESAVTGMVGRLCDAGLLLRVRDAEDARVRKVALTPRGEEALGRMRLALDRINGRMTEALGGEDEVEAFARGLRAVLAAGGGADQA